MPERLISGVVVRLVRAKGYGFVGRDGVDYFFLGRSVEGSPFNALVVGQRVEFSESPSVRGPRAARVLVHEEGGRGPVVVRARGRSEFSPAPVVHEAGGEGT